MSTMKFYYRHDENNSCEVICTRCFAKLGTASDLIAIREMEARHICSRSTHEENSGTHLTGVPRRELPTRTCHLIRRFIGYPGEIQWSKMTAVLACIAVLLYGLPTVGEFFAVRHLNPWLAAILPGDLLGCGCLVAIFRMYRAGILLYLGLTAVEGWLYLSHALAKNALPWMVDIVPAFVVASLILRGRRQGRFRTQISRG